MIINLHCYEQTILTKERNESVKKKYPKLGRKEKKSVCPSETIP